MDFSALLKEGAEARRSGKLDPQVCNEALERGLARAGPQRTSNGLSANSKPLPTRSPRTRHTGHTTRAIARHRVTMRVSVDAAADLCKPRPREERFRPTLAEMMALRFAGDGHAEEARAERVPFLNTFRTMCLSPQAEFRQILRDLRGLKMAA